MAAGSSIHPLRTEHTEQVAIIDWCRRNKQRYPELEYIYHVPNGYARSKAAAGKLKAAGVNPGVPDLVLPVARGGFHGLYLELKLPGNYPDKRQREWMRFLRDGGYFVGVAHGYEEAVEVLERYLNWEKTDP